MAKITGGEQGRNGVISRLVALGAPQPRPEDDAAQWLRIALRSIGAIRKAHKGNHRYAIRIGRSRAERSRVVIGLPGSSYPKPQLSLAGLGDSA
jgi:hypothetical protein